MSFVREYFFVCLNWFKAVHSSSSFFPLDGYDQVDMNSDATGLKNQAVGLLQAVGYLKGIYLL
jgi:hypothetical protein